MGDVSLGRTIGDAVDEYNAKVAAVETTIADFEQAVRTVESQSVIGGTWGEPLFDRSPSLHERKIRDSLLKSAWRHVYNRLQIARVSSAADRKSFEKAVENPPEFTMDNIRATFGDYVLNPREHILRGLAETFVKLDSAYRSHNRVKIGTKGLPKRIILESCGRYGSWGYERLMDVINALRAVQGFPLIEHRDMDTFLTLADMNNAPPEWSENDRYRSYTTVALGDRFYQLKGHGWAPQGVKPNTEDSGWEERIHPEPGLSLRRYQNGNAHLFFSPATLKIINAALAEYYGDVLPDVEDDGTVKRSASTDVAKDLQYYPTPDDVAARVVAEILFRDGQRVLDPSCGCGQLLRALPDNVSSFGIEVHAGRAQQARNAGFKVHTANFLEVPEPRSDDERYDHVVMNPPFYGRHYLKHIRHAQAFLKPGGTLTAILPASAHYDHGELPDGKWGDLPVGSFASSGTRVPTGVFTWRKPAEPMALKEAA